MSQPAQMEDTLTLEAMDWAVKCQAKPRLIDTRTGKTVRDIEPPCEAEAAWDIEYHQARSHSRQETFVCERHLRYFETLEDCTCGEPRLYKATRV